MSENTRIELKITNEEAALLIYALANVLSDRDWPASELPAYRDLLKYIQRSQIDAIT